MDVDSGSHRLQMDEVSGRSYRRYRNRPRCSLNQILSLVYHIGSSSSSGTGSDSGSSSGTGSDSGSGTGSSSSSWCITSTSVSCSFRRILDRN